MAKEKEQDRSDRVKALAHKREPDPAAKRAKPARTILGISVLWFAAIGILTVAILVLVYLAFFSGQ